MVSALLKYYRENGLKKTLGYIKRKLFCRNSNIAYARKPFFSKRELQLQRSAVFTKDILFSILVPLYNTPEVFLREMIESVLHQTYGNWELCMADGSDAEHACAEKICMEYARKDSRIRYRKLDANHGISGNTNACIEMASGNYIGLLDHDDLLHPAALHEVMRAICGQDADFIYTDENSFRKIPEKDAFVPHFKPDFAPDTLRGSNYICHFTCFKADLLKKTGLFDPACDGSQDHDMVLRLTEQAERIVHIPEILYYWRASPGSTAESNSAKPYTVRAGHRALEKMLDRIGLEGEVSDTAWPGYYRIRYKLNGNPKVSILIPNYEHKADLEKCVNSIFEKTTYENFEIVIIENNSTSGEIFSYYRTLQSEHANLRVVVWEGNTFNYSSVNNYGASFAKGEYLLLLNNDTEVITPDWIQEMLMFAQRKDVGAVGAKLYYPDDTIQHAGVGIGPEDIARHFLKKAKRRSHGYMGRLIYAQDLSAVTGACQMIRREVWDEIGGLDESFAFAYNDIDLCMKLRAAAYLVVWTPFAELYHRESVSRGYDIVSTEKKARLAAEKKQFTEKWSRVLEAGDPYYNPNFYPRGFRFSTDRPASAKKRMRRQEDMKKACRSAQ